MNSGLFGVLHGGVAWPCEQHEAAAGNLTLRYQISVEFASGEVATPDVAAKLASALNKLGLRD
jgi:hypothetical protein